MTVMLLLPVPEECGEVDFATQCFPVAQSVDARIVGIEAEPPMKK